MFGGNIPFANKAVSFVDRDMSLVAKRGDIDLLTGPAGMGILIVQPCADYQAKAHVPSLITWRSLSVLRSLGADTRVEPTICPDMAIISRASGSLDQSVHKVVNRWSGVPGRPRASPQDLGSA